MIGSGFIGLEVVEALVHQGKEVRLIELADRVIPDAFDGEITQHIETELREQGSLSIWVSELKRCWGMAG